MSRFDKGAIMLLACGSIGNLVNAVVSRPFEVESAKACQRRPSAVDLLSSSDLRRLQREGMCTISLGKYIGKENMKQVKAHALSLVKEGQLKASGNSMEVRAIHNLHSRVLFVRKIYLSSLSLCPHCSSFLIILTCARFFRCGRIQSCG